LMIFPKSFVPPVTLVIHDVISSSVQGQQGYSLSR
jgi:hypothetical protein